MKRILLACSAGMSTSLIVEKMKTVAKEQGLEYEIWAQAVNEILDDEKPFDVCLIGPQVASKYNKVVKIAAEFGENIPVGIIDKEDYGRMRADKILDLAKELLNDK